MKAKHLFYIALVCLVAILTSCTSVYKYDTNNPTENLLEKNKKIAISVSEDGHFEDDDYTGSGKELATITKQELKRYSNNITILEAKRTIDDFTADDMKQYDYVIIPTILHWEDRATAWTGMPAVAKISVDIYDSNKKLLKSTVLSGKSATWTMGSTDPRDLVDEPLGVFFKSVFDK